MTSPIERLPVEVFDIVLLGLDLDHYQQLRLTSRQLHSLSLSPFAKKYFSAITTTLGSPSLNRLVNVSSHAYLRHAVTQLDVKLLTCRDFKTLTAIRRANIFPPPKRFPVVRGVRPADISEESTLFDDMQDPKHVKSITERMTRSLVGLDNLKVVCFRALNLEPQGWGSKNMPIGDQVFRQRCFQVLMDSIMQAGVQLEEFSMARRTRTRSNKGKNANLECLAFQLHGSANCALSHAFEHLQSLTLSLISKRENSTLVTRAEVYPSQFIACAPNLKHLTLKLDRSTNRSTDSATVFRHVTRSCRLPALENFQLVDCAVYPHDLEQFYDAHAHRICTVSLSRVQILNGTWAAIWTALKRCEKLKLLTVSGLDSPGSTPSVLRRHRSKKKTLDVESLEKSMGDMLDELVDSCYPDKSTSGGLADAIGMWT